MPIRTYVAEDSVLGGSQTPELRVSVPDKSNIGRSIQQLGRQAMGVIETYHRRKEQDARKDDNLNEMGAWSDYNLDDAHYKVDTLRNPSTEGTVDNALGAADERATRIIQARGLEGEAADRFLARVAASKASDVVKFSFVEQELRQGKAAAGLDAMLEKTRGALLIDPSLAASQREMLRGVMDQYIQDGWIADFNTEVKLGETIEGVIAHAKADGLLLKDPSALIKALTPDVDAEGVEKSLDIDFEPLDGQQRRTYIRQAEAILRDKNAINGAQVRAQHHAIVERLARGTPVDKVDLDNHKLVLEGMGEDGAIMLGQLRNSIIAFASSEETAAGTTGATSSPEGSPPMPVIVAPKKGLPAGVKPDAPSATLFPDADDAE